MNPVPKPAKRARKPRAWNSTLAVPRRPKADATKKSLPSSSLSSLPESAEKKSGKKKQQVAGAARAPRSKPIARKSPMKKARRSASDFARVYGSKRRVSWVKEQPCAACGMIGFAENAHVLGNDGMSRKGHHTEIAPLCGAFGLWKCHRRFDEDKLGFAALFPAFNPEQAAARTEAAWQSHLKNGESK